MLRTIRTILLAGALAVGLAATAAASLPPGFEIVPVNGPSVPASPPLPDPGVLPTQLVLDDDVVDASFSLSGAAARQFMWFNRFVHPGEFTLEQIWVLFPNNADVPLNGAVQLVVLLDPDNNLANGADVLGTYDVQIQAKDGDTFSVYTLGTPLDVPLGGEILVGVVNRYFTTGVDAPPTAPAAYDNTLSQNRSYIAIWSGDPPDPPDLATALAIDLMDGSAAGNLMIRAFGGAAVAPPAPPIPLLDGRALALLAAVLGLAGAVLLARR